MRGVVGCRWRREGLGSRGAGGLARVWVTGSTEKRTKKGL